MVLQRQLLAVIIVALALCGCSVGHKPSPAMRRSMCVANMKQLALALNIYADDHDGALPPTLVGLVQKGYWSNNPMSYICWEYADRNWRQVCRLRDNVPLSLIDLTYLYSPSAVRRDGSTVLVRERHVHPSIPDKSLPDENLIIDGTFYVRFVPARPPGSE